MTRLVFAALLVALALGWMGCASRPHAVISGEDSARLQRAKDADARKLIQLEAHEAALVEQARKHAEELAEIERQMALEKRRVTHETEMERAKLEKRKLELQGEIAEAEAEAERIRLLREAMTGDEPMPEGRSWDGRSGYNAAPTPGDGDDWMYVWNGVEWVWKWDPEGRPARAAPGDRDWDEWIEGDEEQAEQIAAAASPSPAPQHTPPDDGPVETALKVTANFAIIGLLFWVNGLGSDARDEDYAIALEMAQRYPHRPEFHPIATHPDRREIRRMAALLTGQNSAL